jgi:hypothetical protein
MAGTIDQVNGSSKPFQLLGKAMKAVASVK